MVYQWSKKLQSWLFPATCRLCLAPGLHGLSLCAPCRAELPWLNHSCHRCAIPLPQEAVSSLCLDCQNTPPALDSCRALFAYRPPVDRWIQALKFTQDLSTARLIGELLAEQLSAGQNQPRPVVLPVPLHRKRLAQRGYNQSLEMARLLQDKGYRLDPGCCRRHRATSAQSGLPASRRSGNVRGAFSLRLPLQERRFLLVDDVMTTGATLNELALTLKKAGALRVEAWVIARTLTATGTGGRH